jgi:hypothetical protein
MKRIAVVDDEPDITTVLKKGALNVMASQLIPSTILRPPS